MKKLNDTEIAELLSYTKDTKDTNKQPPVISWTSEQGKRRGLFILSCEQEGETFSWTGMTWEYNSSNEIENLDFFSVHTTKLPGGWEEHKTEIQ